MMDQLAMEYVASLLTKFWQESFKNFAQFLFQFYKNITVALYHLGCHIHPISEGEVGQCDFVRRWANTCHI